MTRNKDKHFIYKKLETADIKKDSRIKFIQQKEGAKERDVQMDGYYDYNKNTFIETIYSSTDKYDNGGINRIAVSIYFPIRRLNKAKEQDDSPNHITFVI